MLVLVWTLASDTTISTGLAYCCTIGLDTETTDSVVPTVTGAVVGWNIAVAFVEFCPLLAVLLALVAVVVVLLAVVGCTVLLLIIDVLYGADVFVDAVDGTLLPSDPVQFSVVEALQDTVKFPSVPFVRYIVELSTPEPKVSFCPMLPLYPPLPVILFMPDPSP